MAVTQSYDPRQPQNRQTASLSVLPNGKLVTHQSFAPSPLGQASKIDLDACVPTSEELINEVLNGKSTSAIIEEIINVTSR